MNLQPSLDKDDTYGHAKIIDFNHKYNELKGNLQKPNELKEYEDFDLKCVESSFHQQQTDMKRRLSNKKNKDAIGPLGSRETALVAAMAACSLPAQPCASLQQKRLNIDADIRPCEPNER